MKICAIICEYNPFHNGHLYQMEEAKRRSGADALLCIMSGNFVQRGEAAIIEKHTRAKHALLAGADVVIELPTVFATANAELFAKGAVHLLRQIPAITTLCFGAESDDKQAFLSAAKLLNDEPKIVSEKIKEGLANGLSYAKARANAWEGLIPSALLNSPNNILGLEYTRAILQQNATMDILPIARLGSGYRDEKLNGIYASATAIRAAIMRGEDYAHTLPDFVEAELPERLENRLDSLEKYAILSKPAEEIARVCDCTEGLENALKRATEYSASLSETLTSPRYTSSRIRRIALQCLLNVKETLIRESLDSPLYLRVLGIKAMRKDLLSALSQASAPVLLRAHDERKLSGVAKECYERDIFAEKVFGLLYEQRRNKNIFI